MYHDDQRCPRGILVSVVEWLKQWILLRSQNLILNQNNIPEKCEKTLNICQHPLCHYSWSSLKQDSILFKVPCYHIFNTLRPRQNGRHFADNIFKCILVNENVRIVIKISLKFVPKDPINYIPALVQIMAWHRPGDKPLSEPMLVSLLTHICVTRPQWVKGNLMTWVQSCDLHNDKNNIQSLSVAWNKINISPVH